MLVWAAQPHLCLGGADSDELDDTSKPDIDMCCNIRNCEVLAQGTSDRPARHSPIGSRNMWNTMLTNVWRYEKSCMYAAP